MGQLSHGIWPPILEIRQHLQVARFSCVGIRAARTDVRDHQPHVTDRYVQDSKYLNTVNVVWEECQFEIQGSQLRVVPNNTISVRMLVQNTRKLSCFLFCRGARTTAPAPPPSVFTLLPAGKDVFLQPISVAMTSHRGIFPSFVFKNYFGNLLFLHGGGVQKQLLQENLIWQLSLHFQTIH